MIKSIVEQRFIHLSLRIVSIKLRPLRCTASWAVQNQERFDLPVVAGWEHDVSLVVWRRISADQSDESEFHSTWRSFVMKCPACESDLRMSERSGVEIDYCPGCRGVWLDRGELDKIIVQGSSESATDAVSLAIDKHA